MTSRWLNPAEDKAWRGFRRMFTLVEARLARELADDTGLSMADYTVLSNLVEVEGREWRVTELADYMTWTQSRLSHQLRRMEQRGLVARRQATDDRRGALVTLTSRGFKAIAAATPGHMTAVRKHVIDRLTPDEIDALGEIAAKVVQPLAEPDGNSARS